MNEKRRGQLRDALKLLSNVEIIVDAVYDKEQGCLDNYPENLQESERFEKMECAVDNLSDALDKLDDVREHIELAIR